MPDENLTDFLMSYLTPHKRTLFEEILPWRTRYLTVVFESLFQSQNVSAGIRTAECFGIQDIHYIDDRRGKFKVNKNVVKGASKWLDVFHHDTSSDCIKALRKKGYAIVATTPRADLDLAELPLDKPIAVFFGNELHGLTEEVENSADYCIRIPIRGFTESYNISVSTALTLQKTVERLHDSSISWQLSEQEKNELRLEWAKRSVRHSEPLSRAFLSRNEKKHR